MKLYLDKELTEEVQEIIDFGTLLAGEEKEFTFYVQNETNAHIKELEFSIEHSELEVIESPKELVSQAVGRLIIKWVCDVTLKEGLVAQLHIKGIELYG